MSSIKGGMERNIPALPSLEKEIIFWDMDFNSTSFRLKLGSIINDLNYVVIAAGDDEQNMNMAIDIYEYTIRNRNKGLSKFRIFVRAYDKSNERKMEAVEYFYSIVDADKNNEANKNDEANKVINVFGKKEQIYTYSNIIEDENTLTAAKDFFIAYTLSCDPTVSYKKAQKDWDDREKAIKSSTTKYTDRLEKEHKRIQDFSNVYHMYTKTQLCRYLDEIPYPVNSFSFEREDEAQDENYITCLRYLSELEHLRWNASHYMAGFVYGKEKDFRKKTHPCLKPLEDLDENTQRFDYAVVKNTIELYQKNVKTTS
jgi:hypothetical protein